MADETTTPTVHKPGFKTSEFWLTTAAMIVGSLIASGAIGETTQLGRAIAFIASALAAAGYSWSRGTVKSK